MNKPTHTPEPWRIIRTDLPQPVIASESGQYVVAIPSEVNASRIVECVNAMEGIENPVQFMNEAIDLLKLCKARFEVKESVLKSPTIITRIDNVNQLISK